MVNVCSQGLLLLLASFAGCFQFGISSGEDFLFKDQGKLTTKIIESDSD
jgi:hypothetical protein